MFRFTIRDLLWLTVVVALGAAWCADHLGQGSRNYPDDLRDSEFRVRSLKRYLETVSAAKVTFQRSEYAEEVIVQDAKQRATYKTARAPLSGS